MINIGTYKCDYILKVENKCTQKCLEKNTWTGQTLNRGKNLCKPKVITKKTTITVHKFS